MIVLGLDVAKIATGWALIDTRPVRPRAIAYGVLKRADAKMIRDFADSQYPRVDRCELVAVEDQHLDKNVNTLKALVEFRGRFMQEFESRDHKVQVIMADEWQRGLLAGMISARTRRSGRKSAAEKWCRLMVDGLDKAVPQDVYDATCMAVFAGKRAMFAQKVSR